MKRGVGLLTLAAVVGGGLLSGEALAIKGKLTIMNCTGKTVQFCSYRKDDVAMRIPDRSGGIDNNTFQSKVGCGTNGGCKVIILEAGKLCEVATKNEVYVPSQTLGEYAYWLKKDAKGKYYFEKASDDRAYFDTRSCPK
mgnify:CR=1 FL=1